MPDEVPLNRDNNSLEVEFKICRAGDEFAPYFDMQVLAAEVYNSRPEEHRFGSFQEWYDRLMHLEELDRLEITVRSPDYSELLAVAVLTEVEDHHYGIQLSEVFKVTDGSRVAAKALVMSYRAMGSTLGKSEYIEVRYTGEGYLRKLRGIKCLL